MHGPELLAPNKGAVNLKRLVGLILTTCNDLEMAKAAYISLHESMSDGYPFGFIIVDSGSTDGTVEHFEQRSLVFGPHRHKEDFDHKTEHLCEALNAGIKLWLGDYVETTGEFQKEGGLGYIGWIHADMEFLQKGWLEKLVRYCEENPDVGKVSPDDWGTNHETRPGNSCPWIMPIKALKALYLKDGYFFDENFHYTQDLDDWDLNQRLINHGYKVMVCSESKVKHEGMGTRKHHTDKKYKKARIHNRMYYKEKWGDIICPV